MGRNGELWLLWSLLRGKPLPVWHWSVSKLQEEGGTTTLVAIRILLGTGQGGECTARGFQEEAASGVYILGHLEGATQGLALPQGQSHTDPMQLGLCAALGALLSSYRSILQELC